MSQSSYQTNDGLSSEPAQLVVRHPPAEPRIYTDGRTFASEKQLSVLADREQVLTCESRGGNPAPLLTWWLGDIKLEASQRNESEASPDIKQWTAVSSLVHTFSKLDNRREDMIKVGHSTTLNVENVVSMAPRESQTTKEKKHTSRRLGGPQSGRQKKKGSYMRQAFPI